MPFTLPLPAELTGIERHTRPRPVRILLVGAGGTGSHVLTGLARMHAALVQLRHPGFEVVAMDPDTVSESNVGRQMFSPADVGQPKSVVLIHRINLFFGLHWQAATNPFTPLPKGAGWEETGKRGMKCDLVISCVDSAKARRTLRDAFASGHGHANWWLDIGNDARTAQFILGNFREDFLYVPDETKRDGMVLRRTQSPVTPSVRIPNILDLFPKLDNPKHRESTAPSCSLAESLKKQDLFINQTAATLALDTLWEWIRRGKLTHHGAFINLGTKTVRPLPIDPATWERMNPKLKPAGEPKAACKKTRQADTK
jgi:PRTRC genetic system ThiF family protein